MYKEVYLSQANFITQNPPSCLNPRFHPSQSIHLIIPESSVFDIDRAGIKPGDWRVWEGNSVPHFMMLEHCVVFEYSLSVC